MNFNRMLVIAVAMLAMSDCAMAKVYKCSGVYQDAPCSADQDEGRVKRTSTKGEEGREKAATPVDSAMPAAPATDLPRRHSPRGN